MTAEDVACIVLRPDGYLARVARDCEVIAFVNKVATPTARQDARGLAEALRASDAGHRLAHVVIGDVRAGVFERAA